MPLDPAPEPAVQNATSGARGVASVKNGDPLYVQVARTLKDEIVSGVYPVGSLIPTEDILCGRFSVSRYTVREALRRLRDDGLVSSRQGAGTRVEPSRSRDSYIHEVMSINDLMDFAAGTRLEIDTIRMTRIEGKRALRTGLHTREEWLEVRGYRHAETAGSGICRTEYYINRAFASVGRLLQRHTGPIFPLIEDMFGQNIVEVRQEITATLVTPDLAEGLGILEGSAALEVRRCYITTEGLIAQVTINTHPASRFRHSMTMRRVKN